MRGRRRRRSKGRQQVVSFEFVSLHISGQFFILIGSDKIDSRFQRSLPAARRRIPGAEVVTVFPAESFVLMETIQSVEADPITHAMRVIDKGAKPALVDGG